jgi:hypothetical protein
MATAEKNILTLPKPDGTLTIRQKTNTTKTFFVLAAVVLIFVAGFRYGVGTDYFAYWLGYKKYANEFLNSLLSLQEPGFKFICWVSVLIGGNGSTVIFLSSFITVFLFLKTIYNNTNMLLPATLLYIFLGCWHGAFNGVRQYLAAAIIFSGVHFIKERKFWKYALVVFIAFLFHGSAMVMIFPYFIAYNKISFPNLLFLITASIIVLFSFTEIIELTNIILNDDITDAGNYLTRSVNIFRVLVAIAPPVFFLFVYQNKSITKEQQFWINMLVINAVVMFATSNSAYLARINIYTISFVALAIPELINGMNPKDKTLTTNIILVLFFAFWLYEISISNSLNNFRFIWNKI